MSHLTQVYMDICIAKEESYKGVTTHMELKQTSFLSNLACTIPLPDFNQVFCRLIFSNWTKCTA